MTQSLGELEHAVMNALWKSGEALSVREVQTLIGRRHALAYTTVLTVLDRLHSKGFVQRGKDGRAFLYRPRLSQAEWVGNRAARVLASEAGADRAVLAAFVASADLADPRLLDELSHVIRAHQHRGRRG